MGTEGFDFGGAFRAGQAERRREQVRAWGQRNPLKRRAYRFVQDALYFGYLVRPSRCARCDKPCKPHAHHHDYSTPLDVEWLCTTCHGKEHRSVTD